MIDRCLISCAALVGSTVLSGSSIGQPAPLPTDGSWPPRGQLNADPDIVRMGPEVALRADCKGVPIYGFGFSFIYGLSPDLDPESKLQVGNIVPATKIKPKKSWEIRSNRIGATPPRMPRTARSDIRPFVGVHLIDDDPDTYWSSRGQNQADVEPAWFRIDLAKETKVHAIELIPRADHDGMPGHLTIKLSRDGWHWDTVYDNEQHTLPKGSKTQRIDISPTNAKQIWVIGQNLPRNFTATHIFSIAEARVLDATNENVASASRGAAASVSSFESWIDSQRETHQTLWPTHYDLGVEWIRVNYAGSVLNWRVVEREKGIYEIDPIADAAITEAVKNGCKINFGLGFTNWLYSSAKPPTRAEEKQSFLSNELIALSFPGPKEPQMLEGFKNFVRFMVNHFKDRVDYYEIWNEQSNGYGGWLDGGPELYTQWVKELVPIIEEIDPNAKIVFGSLSGLGPRREVGIDWLERCLKAGIAPYVDMIAWHDYYGAAPGDRAWEGYADDVKETKELAESYGFKGEYCHSEWCIFAPYPQNSTQGLPAVTEMVKAKHIARFAMINLGLDVVFYWNETWADGHIDRDVGLFRNAFSGSPVSETQPQPCYYVLRTLCTVMDEVRPASLNVEFSNREKPLEVWAFRHANGNYLLSVSLTGPSADDSPVFISDIHFPGNTFSSATGINVLNGTEQKLNLSADSDGSSLLTMEIKDYPVLIRLSSPD